MISSLSFKRGQHSLVGYLHLSSQQEKIGLSDVGQKYWGSYMMWSRNDSDSLDHFKNIH